MPIAVILIIAAAWFITNGIYRMIVGTKCVFQGVEPPWVAARQEKLTQREIRRGQRREVLDSRRTARGFLARLWGDAWEWTNKWADGLGQGKDNAPNDLDTPTTPTAEPVEYVPADGGASWWAALGDKLKGWADKVGQFRDDWFAPSANHCQWKYPAGNSCGKKAAATQRFCREHRRDEAVGHCLWGDGNPDVEPCLRPREDDYAFCTEHMDEWEARVQQPTGAGAPLGTLTTPEVPIPTGASAAAPTSADSPRCLWGRATVAGLDTTPDHGHTPCTEAPGANSAYCAKHQAEINKQSVSRPCQWGRTTDTRRPDHGRRPCDEAAKDGSSYCHSHTIAIDEWKTKNRYGQPTCTWRDDPAAAPCGRSLLGGTGKFCEAHQPLAPASVGTGLGGRAEGETPEERERRAAEYAWNRPSCPAPISASGAVCGMPMHKVPGGWTCYLPHAPEQGPAVPPEPPTETPPVGSDTEPEVPPQRPQLRIVPNTDPQGEDANDMSLPVPVDKPYVAPPRRDAEATYDTNPHYSTSTRGDNGMTAPTQQSVGEATNTQKVHEFAQSVIKAGIEDWPSSIEAAKQQMGSVKLTNDPNIVAALGQIDEAAKALAAAGQSLDAAVSAHDGATEQVSGLGEKAADTQAYQNQ